MIDALVEDIVELEIKIIQMKLLVIMKEAAIVEEDPEELLDKLEAKQRQLAEIRRKKRRS